MKVSARFAQSSEGVCAGGPLGSRGGGSHSSSGKGSKGSSISKCRCFDHSAVSTASSTLDTWGAPLGPLKGSEVSSW